MKTETTFEALFFAHYETLCKQAHRYIVDGGVCEDIVQDCFIKFWEKTEQGKSIEQPLGYLKVAVKNTCLNYIKSQKNTEIFTEQIAENIKKENENQNTDYSTDEIVQKALAELPPKCRTIFEMSRLQEKSYKQIAEELSISIKTVENQMGKAIRITRDFATKNPQFFTFLIVHFNLKTKS